MGTQSPNLTLIFPLLKDSWTMGQCVKHPCISHQYGILLTDQDGPWVL